ncbi:hypothetical protein [Nocardioides marmorisolisilvae]|uniref:Uncharacterized protein n=1 Tax=Nocardioides marmorisolisilvae TaxID=1542737 RepID=A0A3N0DVB1_9ACTN|nr:hypothetical protein [Nocardioides marmorisolisilvae]RNL79491.1 hypothetical protein EFL95_10940 [Nocardioides marmorisolisilvae]
MTRTHRHAFAVGGVSAALAAYTLGPWLPGDWLARHATLWWIWLASVLVLGFACVLIGIHLWSTEERATLGFGLVWGSVLFYLPFWGWVFLILLPSEFADG